MTVNSNHAVQKRILKTFNHAFDESNNILKTTPRFYELSNTYKSLSAKTNYHNSEDHVTSPAFKTT